MENCFDVIILGSGISGLTAAIFLKEAGLNVAVITKEVKIEESNTYYAQGGIIAWREEDSPQQLYDDLLKAGCYYNKKKAVSQLVKNGPKLVFDFLIDKIGIDFSKNSNNEIDYTDEAAHSIRRIIHYKDYTGQKIETELIAYCQKNDIRIFNSFTAIDLISNNHHSRDYQELYKKRQVYGVYVLDNEQHQVKSFFADYIILATGGVGNLYQHTTNPQGATGDGISMAYRAGADIINAEFLQFHPTSLYHKDIKRFLISESLRGEGARLINPRGERFMERYSPLLELAPRDVVARAIYEEMGLFSQEYMLLDLSNFYKGSKPIQQRFSLIYKTCLNGGIDITRQPIPIVPAAHYCCGGVKVNNAGKTSINKLYAIGEVSCTGIHGANRLASSSLLEGIYWAYRASQSIVKKYKKTDAARFSAIPHWKTPKHTVDFDLLLFKQDLKAIQMTMWNYAGIMRTSKGLERAKADLNYYAHRIFKFYKEAKINKTIIELRNAIVTASIIVNAATHNNKSIGCHYIKE